MKHDVSFVASSLLPNVNVNANVNKCFPKHIIFFCSLVNGSTKQWRTTMARSRWSTGKIKKTNWIPTPMIRTWSNGTVWRDPADNSTQLVEKVKYLIFISNLDGGQITWWRSNIYFSFQISIVEKVKNLFFILNINCREGQISNFHFKSLLWRRSKTHFSFQISIVEKVKTHFSF